MKSKSKKEELKEEIKLKNKIVKDKEIVKKDDSNKGLSK